GGGAGGGGGAAWGEGGGGGRGGDEHAGVAGLVRADAEDVLGEEERRGGAPSMTMTSRQAIFVGEGAGVIGLVVHLPEGGGAGVGLLAPVGADGIDEGVVAVFADEGFEEEEHEKGAAGFDEIVGGIVDDFAAAIGAVGA